MKRWNVRARVSVDVSMDVMARGPEDAREMIGNHLIMIANMVDLEAFGVLDGSICDFQRNRIHGHFAFPH